MNQPSSTQEVPPHGHELVRRDVATLEPTPVGWDVQRLLEHQRVSVSLQSLHANGVSVFLDVVHDVVAFLGLGAFVDLGFGEL